MLLTVRARRRATIFLAVMAVAAFGRLDAQGPPVLAISFAMGEKWTR